MSDAVEIRPVHDDDAADVAELLAHLGYPTPAEDVPVRLDRLRARGDADAFVALAENRVVGLATVHARDVLHNARPVVQLTALVVSPAMRSRGVGRELVVAVERWALDRGADRLVVTTALHRADAPRFYERIGFEQTGRRFAKRLVALLLVCAALVALSASRAGAQVRERPIPFDSAGRVDVVTPPLAARLGLAPPVWPVSGDYLDVRLYAVEDTAGSAVLVVRRPREVLDRFVLSATERRALVDAVSRGAAMARAGGDSLPAQVSGRTQGWFVVNQSLLGVLIFGPAAAALGGNAAAGTAAYLAVAGGTFFLAAERARAIPISTAENHLAWHGARQGAAAAYLAAYALGGENLDGKAAAAAVLVGGVVGDVVGYRIARPMTDAEAHGVSHGATVTTALATGVLGMAGSNHDESSRRAAAAITIGAQAVGYPLGLRYARVKSYRVTAGDVGTLVAGEMIGVGALATLIPNDPSDLAIGGLLTGGFALGALVADQALVQRFDYTESESRLLQLGTVAGGVVGLAIPVLAESDDGRAIIGAATLGGLLGAVATHNLLAPARAASPRRTGATEAPRRVGVRFTPENILFARSGRAGIYPILNLTF